MKSALGPAMIALSSSGCKTLFAVLRLIAIFLTIHDALLHTALLRYK